jgi:NAD(P)-dependent dehydrogenase (short-subunit alcohol dehydrogenase family)
VVIGGSSGIGLETARRARSEGANVVLTGRDPARLQREGNEVDALSLATTSNCETTLIAGNVDYSPDPVEPPTDGSVFICCSQPRDDIELDL